MFLWLKQTVASNMVRLGVDWPGMSDGDKLNAFVGLCIGGLGVVIAILAVIIAIRQTQIAERQAEIAEVQHQISLEQQSRLVRLDMWAHLFTHTGEEISFVIRARNIGKKTSLQWKWFVRIHDMLGPTIVRRYGETEPLRPLRVMGFDSSVYSDNSSVPLFPGEDLPLLIVQTTKLGTIDWHFGTEDGRSPETGSGVLSLQDASQITQPPW